jgi:hypothetical protein
MDFRLFRNANPGSYFFVNVVWLLYFVGRVAVAAALAASVAIAAPHPPPRLTARVNPTIYECSRPAPAPRLTARVYYIRPSPHAPRGVQGTRFAVATSQVDRPAPTTAMRSIVPSIVGLTLAVNLGAGGGQPWWGAVNLANTLNPGGTRSTWARRSHPGLPQIRCFPQPTFTRLPICQPADLRPGSHQTIICQRLLRPPFAFTQRIQAVC